MPVEALKRRSEQPAPRMTLGEFKSGNEDAFRRVSPRLHSIASRVVGSDGAEDVVQDAYIRMSGSKKTEKDFPNGDIFSFLAVIVRNRAIDEVRRQNRRLMRESVPANDQNPTDSVADPETTEGIVHEVVNSDELTKTTREIVHNPLMAETFLLVEVGGLKYSEVAAQHGVAEGTVKSRVHRAKRDLKKGLVKDGVGNVYKSPPRR